MNVEDLKQRLVKLRIPESKYSVDAVLPNRFILGQFNSKWHTYYYDENENVYAYADFASEREACMNMLKQLLYHRQQLN